MLEISFSDTVYAVGMVSTFGMVVSAWSEATDLIDWLRSQGVRVNEGGHTFYVGPQDAMRRLIPSLVASGDHSAPLERICDALAGALGAERLIAPGAGHFVAAAPSFADRLEQFLNSVS